LGDEKISIFYVIVKKCKKMNKNIPLAPKGIFNMPLHKGE